MSKLKRYSCCICHKELTNYKPIRLVKQVHDEKVPYGKYHNMKNYDFCKECYARFNHWIKKHNEGKINV